MSERMIEVPAEAFGLLFAYCFTGQRDVPAAVRAHPDFPSNRDHRRGHLTKVLRPYAEKAWGSLLQGNPNVEG